jgi:thiamine biosynthesis lipoprotein
VLRESSLATSALYYQKRARGEGTSFVDGRTRQSLAKNISVSVCAPDCMTADALTKIVIFMPDKASAILDRHQAKAFILRGNIPTIRHLNGDRTQCGQA